MLIHKSETNETDRTWFGQLHGKEKRTLNDCLGKDETQVINYVTVHGIFLLQMHHILFTFQFFGTILNNTKEIKHV